MPLAIMTTKKGMKTDCARREKSMNRSWHNKIHPRIVKFFFFLALYNCLFAMLSTHTIQYKMLLSVTVCASQKFMPWNSAYFVFLLLGAACCVPERGQSVQSLHDTPYNNNQPIKRTGIVLS